MTTPLAGAVTVVTGGASGIGLALAERFAVEGAAAVVVVDVDAGLAAATADRLGGGRGHAFAVDVADAAAVGGLVAQIEVDIGPIDVWCSNAGIAAGDGLGDDDDWQRSWQLHVLAHLHAARHVLPRMVARGHGHLMITASAAGLLTEMDSAPYTVTKHGAVALAEWLAIRYGGSGVGFSCLCPQAVRTPMTAALPPNSATLATGPMLEPAEVADAAVAAIREGRFLILPHRRVSEYEQRRAADRDRWLAGMRRVRAELEG
jgi:NAD(P)-dependent dehydrogenase (short-subunit alcohol dehydrogenase family)